MRVLRTLPGGYPGGTLRGWSPCTGPKIADFTYAIIVSTKWPRWIALLTIAVTFIGSMMVGSLGGALTLPQREERTRAKGYVTLGFAGVFAVALAALSYWSIYASDETWGSDPPSDLTALVDAFAAAIGGLITAKKLLSGNA